MLGDDGDRAGAPPVIGEADDRRLEQPSPGVSERVLLRLPRFERGHCPAHFGGRFWTNASIPSRASSDANSRADSACTSSACAANAERAARFVNGLVSASPWGEQWRSASVIVASSAS